jgi:hypothetical protein
MQYPRLARPQWFELFAAVNLIVIIVALRHITNAPLQTLPRLLPSLVAGFLGQVLVGAGIRAALAWRRGNLRQLLHVFCSASWLIDTLRMAIFSALTVHAYGWIKLAVPLLHHQLFDRQVSDLGRAIFFGYSPGAFIAALFSSPLIMRAIDWAYANLFILTLNVSVVCFVSSPSRRLRVAFMDANTTMWLIGAWVYLAVPTLGPAYVYPESFLPLAPLLPHTQVLQRMLMSNYQAVLGYLHGARQPVNIFLGIGAFPSLHVAFQALVWLWMRRLWRWAGFLFGLIAITIFLGSVITGWHYFMDGVAGFVLAWACFRASLRWHRVERFLAICAGR